MPHTSPACFRGGAAEAVAGEAAAALVTSVYETCVGIVALSWSRSRLGLSLRVDLFLSPSEEEEEEEEEETLRFRIRPWLLWKRRGSKRFPLKRRRRHFVDLAWDLTKARFSGAAAPEPAAGYFVSVAVDGEVVLVAGDLRGDAAIADPHRHRQTLISRREHVVIGRPGASRTYRTTARLGGREREIAIELREAEQAKAMAKANAKEKERGRGSGEMGMLIMVDGNCVLNVPQLRWTFRGSAAAAAAAAPAAEGGGRIRVSWDLHNWLFRLRNDSATATTAPESGDGDAGDAVFVFRFERDGNGGDTTTKENSNTEEGYFGKRDDDFAGRGYFGKRDRKNWSGSGCSNNSGGGRGRKKSLVKASSSSSVSSTASTSTTVAGWASPEDAEMQRGDVFSLLVYAWRS